MELSAPLPRALSNKANLFPTTTQQSLFTALISPSSFYTFSYRDGLKQKTHKIATKPPTHSSAVTCIIIIIMSDLIPDILPSRSLSVRNMTHNEEPVH